MSKKGPPEDVEAAMDAAAVTYRPETALAERYPTGCLQITAATPPEQWPTSLARGSREWQAAVINCQTTPDVEVAHEWSEPFLVVHWLVMVRESADEKTGEIRQYPWLAMICHDGSIIGTSSEVVPHQLARALRMIPAEQWAKGVLFKIRRRQSRAGGRSYHELRVVY